MYIIYMMGIDVLSKVLSDKERPGKAIDTFKPYYRCEESIRGSRLLGEIGKDVLFQLN